MRPWRGIFASLVVHAAAAGMVLASIAETERTVEDVPSVPTELVLEIDSSPIPERQAVEEEEAEPIEAAALPPPPAVQETPVLATPALAEPVSAPPPQPAAVKPAAPSPRTVKVEKAKPAPKQKPSATLPAKSVRQKAALAAGKGSTGKQRSTDGAAAEQSYKSKILARLRSAKRYPDGARRNGIEGTAVLSFTIDASGRLTAARISGRSGQPALDDAALAMAHKAAPFPPFPKGMARQQMTFRVPVQFAID